MVAHYAKVFLLGWPKRLQILLQVGKLRPELKAERIVLRKGVEFMKIEAIKRIFVLLWLTAGVFNLGCQAGSGPPRPLIGITSVYEVDKESPSTASTTVDFAYVKAVAENGGVPVVLPTIDDRHALQQYVDLLDGLVLVGGEDIPPSAYGQQPHETVKMLPKRRYDFERKLISLWLASGKPVLGVCLGMQFTNVVAGGTMIQDIPSQVATTVGHRRCHTVNIEPGSLLAQILDTDQVLVYSNHHQAVSSVGNDLRVIARSDDGVIEALERIGGGFGLFVQWHPELMTDDTAHRDAIYGALVGAALTARN